MNVQSVAIGECVKVIGGFAFKSKDFGETGKPVIRISNIQNGIVHTEGAVRILPEKVGKGSKSTITGGDILMALSGATTGKVGVVPIHIDGPVYLNQRVGKFEIVNNMIIERAYLRHYLESGVIQSQVWKSAAGVAQPNISPKQLEAYQIPLPPLSEQKRIAAILDKADALRAKRHQAIAKLDELLYSVFLDMFGDPVTNPKGWKLNKIKKLSKVMTGNTPSRKNPDYYGNSIEWIKADNLNNDSDYITPATEYLSEEGISVARLIPKGSILVTCIAGTPSCIGNLGIADRDLAFNQQINAMVPDDGCCEYFYCLLKYSKKLIQAASTNSMKGMVSKSRFENITLIDPPMPLKKRFLKYFKHNQISKINMVSHLVNCNCLFSSLQQRAFNGEL